MNPAPCVISIAGSDPAGGAGIQADLKTFLALGVHGCAVPAALTVQDTRGVRDIFLPDPAFTAASIRALREDLDIHAWKLGMLGSATVIDAVHGALEGHPAPIVVDPVLVSSSGRQLLDDPGLAALVRLLRRAAVLTPNRAEAARLLGREPAENAEAHEQQARDLLSLGPVWVLLKGGHFDGEDSVDVLAGRDGSVHRFGSPRLRRRNTRGTGCTLAAAVAARLALGDPVPAACRAAHNYLHGALAAADRRRLGHGSGALDHGWNGVTADGR
jgi:hydroxymethylpyrimidine/phosphomethylpyrimidine kinase